MFFLIYVKEKFVGPVNILQDQLILGVTGPTDQGMTLTFVTTDNWSWCSFSDETMQQSV